LSIMSSHEARTDANQCSPGVSMAFSSRPSVPLLITNSKKEFDIMTAMKYSQPMALSNCVSYGSDKNCFVFKVLVRNCEDESRILNDPHRITAVESVKYWYIASNAIGKYEAVLYAAWQLGNCRTGKYRTAEVNSRVLNYVNFRKKYLRECPGRRLKANKNLHIPLKANIVQ
ncbi:conserved hypothetical protein, partial [Trichinella spiralis]|uniref:hypothetical protein n=1 Tax=Trichinella spiralis TaxID=6334 RepID=UPI0001EFC3EA